MKVAQKAPLLESRPCCSAWGAYTRKPLQHAPVHLLRLLPLRSEALVYVVLADDSSKPHLQEGGWRSGIIFAQRSGDRVVP